MKKNRGDIFLAMLITIFACSILGVALGTIGLGVGIGNTIQKEIHQNKSQQELESLKRKINKIKNNRK